MPSTVRELEIRFRTKIKGLRREQEIHRQCAEETTKRLESDLNHISTAISECLKKDEYQARHQPLEDRLTALTSRIDKIEARGQGRGDFWGWIVGAIGTMAAIGTWLAMMIQHK